MADQLGTFPGFGEFPIRLKDNGDGSYNLGTTATTTPSGTQDENLKQVNGTTVDTNSGNKSAGTQRVVLATDQPALTAALKVDGSAVTQPVIQGAPAAANVLAGYQGFTSTTGATTIITVPQNRTWVGTIGASCSCAEVAAGTAAPIATATITTAGTGVTPAAGTYFLVDARAGANAATGTVGDGCANFGSTPFVVVAPAGNAVTIQVASTNAGTTSRVDAFASGVLI